MEAPNPYAPPAIPSLPAMRMTKQPAFWAGRFLIEKTATLTAREELNLFLSYMMLVMLERQRG